MKKYKSGKHKNPRRKITDTREEFDKQDILAVCEDKDWAVWARDTLREATDEMDDT